RRPTRPALCPLRAGVDLIPEVQQADVAERLRPEAADLDVVLEEGEGLAQPVRAPRKELALIVEARAPGQDAADVQAFPLDLEEDVLGPDPLGRVGVVRAAGRMDVMIADVVPVRVRVDP